MNPLIIFVSFFALAMAQRPMYAGQRPIRYPDLANRFKDENASTTAAPLENRFGEGGTTQRLPVDALGDAQLVDRLNKWPEGNKPFWLLNAEQIEKHRGGSQPVASISQPSPTNSNKGLPSNSNQGSPVNGNQGLPEGGNQPLLDDGVALRFGGGADGFRGNQGGDDRFIVPNERERIQHQRRFTHGGWYH